MHMYNTLIYFQDRSVDTPDLFKVGEKVLARWKDKFFYPAIIQNIKNNDILVKFTDDKIFHTVKKHMSK